MATGALSVTIWLPTVYRFSAIVGFTILPSASILGPGGFNIFTIFFASTGLPFYHFKPISKICRTCWFSIPPLGSIFGPSGFNVLPLPIRVLPF